MAHYQDIGERFIRYASITTQSKEGVADTPSTECQRDLARRKGENKTIATEEERYILERVTGFTYEALWNIDNARGFEKTGKA